MHWQRQADQNAGDHGKVAGCALQQQVQQSVVRIEVLAYHAYFVAQAYRVEVLMH